jgi:hypothetical protein
LNALVPEQNERLRDRTSKRTDIRKKKEGNNSAEKNIQLRMSRKKVLLAFCFLIGARLVGEKMQNRFIYCHGFMEKGKSKRK